MHDAYVVRCAPHTKMGWVKKGAGKVLTDGGSDTHAQYSTTQHSPYLAAGHLLRDSRADANALPVACTWRSDGVTKRRRLEL